MGALADLLDRFGSDAEDDRSAHERIRTAVGAAPAAETLTGLGPRRVVDVAGTVVALTRSAIGDAPRLDIVVDDGSMRVGARFLGRRAIDGIAQGRAIVLTGRFTTARGQRPLALNPSYRILPTPEDAPMRPARS